MHLVRTMKGKTRFVYVILSVFMVTFLLNVMMLRINIIESQELGPKTREIFHEINKEEAYENYIAMGQRKPKAANENEYYLKEFLQKSVIQNGFIKNVESKNLILGENSFQNQNSAKYQKHILLQTLQEKPLENGLMGDIQKTKWQDKQNNDDVQDYDEDEDYDDEDEDENSMNDEKQNEIFEPGDFVNVSKIIFARPLLKYQEVPITEQQAPTISDNEEFIRRKYQTLDGRYIVNGIYWSDLAENLVPKGKVIN